MTDDCSLFASDAFLRTNFSSTGSPLSATIKPTQKTKNTAKALHNRERNLYHRQQPFHHLRLPPRQYSHLRSFAVHFTRGLHCPPNRTNALTSLPADTHTHTPATAMASTTSPTNQQNSPRAHLLGLPAELRNRIYRYALLSSKPIESASSRAKWRTEMRLFRPSDGSTVSP